jgi:hypothetical protein
LPKPYDGIGGDWKRKKRKEANESKKRKEANESKKRKGGLFTGTLFVFEKEAFSQGSFSS